METGRRNDPRERAQAAWALATIAVGAGLFVLVFHDRFDFEGFWEFFPFRAFARDSLAAGIVPAWMPSIRCGFPVLASAETGIANPLNLVVGGPAIYLLFPILTLLASGYWTWRFFRRWGAEPAPAAVAALPWIAGSVPLYWFSNVNNLFVLALFPAALLAVETYLAGRTRALVWLALALGGMIVGGHPQLAAFNWIALAIYAAARLSTHPHLSGRRLRSVLALAGAGVLGVALGAVQILPLAELIPETARPDAGEGFRKMGSLSISMLGHLLVPCAFDFPSMGEVDFLPYAGLLVLIAALATLRRPGVRGVAPLWIAAATTIVLALGSRTPLWNLVMVLPGFSMLRKSYWFASYAMFFLCALAGIGLTDAARSKTEGGWLATLPTLAATVAVGIAIAGYGQSPAVRALNGRAWLMTGLFLTLSLGAWHALGRLRGFTGYALAAGAVLLDLLACGLVENPPRAHSIFETALLRPSPAAKWMRTHPGDYARMAYLPRGIYETGMADVDSVPSSETDVAYGVKTFWGWDEPSLAPRRAVAVVGRAFDRQVHVPYLSAASVGLIWSGGPLHEPGLVPVVEWDEGVLYRNERALPRSYLAPGVRVADNADAALEVVASSDFDPRGQTVTEGPLAIEALDAPGPVRVVRDEPGRAELEVIAERRSLVVFTESYDPGWRAAVDGKATPVFPVNVQFQGTVVEPGAHRVEFVYHAPGLRLGIAISALALILCFALAFALRDRVQVHSA